MASHDKPPGDSKSSFHRKLLIFVGVALAVSSLVGVLTIPSIIFKKKCRLSMEKLLKTRVEISSARISLSVDRGVIEDLVVYNPEGYVDKPFLVVPKTTFENGPVDPDTGITRVTSIVLHDPVIYLVVSGETSNLKDIMAQMMVPTENPPQQISIASLKIINGTISSYPDERGHQNVSPFPIDEINNLEGPPGEVANRIAMELQKKMDLRLKETVKALKADLIKGFSDLFDF